LAFELIVMPARDVEREVRRRQVVEQHGAGRRVDCTGDGLDRRRRRDLRAGRSVAQAYAVEREFAAKGPVEVEALWIAAAQVEPRVQFGRELGVREHAAGHGLRQVDALRADRRVDLRLQRERRHRRRERGLPQQRRRLQCDGPLCGRRQALGGRGVPRRQRRLARDDDRGRRLAADFEARDVDHRGVDPQARQAHAADGGPRGGVRSFARRGR
jgi:hypothetical protein